ncbi:MAG: type 4a pilus biogenesis protein PilO [bacterium]
MKIINKIILLSAITLVGLGLILAISIYPALKEMKSITKETNLIRKDLEIKYQKGQRIKQTTQDLKKIEPSINQLSRAYLKEGDELKLITTLEQLAQQNNLEQKINLEFKNQETKGQAILAPIQIILNGDFASILKYLSALEQLDYSINLNNFIFRQADKAQFLPAAENIPPPLDLTQAVINGFIYWQPKTTSP